MPINKRGKYWWIDYRDSEGTRHRYSLGVTRKDVAKIKEAEILKSKELAGAGIDTHPRTQKKSIDDLLADYKAYSLARGNTESHVNESVRYLCAVFNAAGIRTVKEATTAKLEGALGLLSDRSNRTQNKVLSYVKAFFNWLVSSRRWAINPAAPLKRLKDVAALMPRRALTPEEFSEILKTAPPARALLYSVAVTTGLRRSELASLTWDDVDLTHGLVTIRAQNAKNSKTETLYLPPPVVQMWSTWSENPIALRGSKKVLLETPLPPPPNMKTFYRDLWVAGIIERERKESKGKKGAVRWVYKTESPRGRLDFHALRNTYATWMAQEQIGLSLAQDLMRHSDPKLTSTVYTKFQPKDRRKVADTLGKYFGHNLDANEDHDSAETRKKA